VLAYAVSRASVAHSLCGTAFFLSGTAVVFWLLTLMISIKRAAGRVPARV
jgi:hypothetical protein